MAAKKSGADRLRRWSYTSYLYQYQVHFTQPQTQRNLSGNAPLQFIFILCMVCTMHRSYTEILPDRPSPPGNMGQYYQYLYRSGVERRVDEGMSEKATSTVLVPVVIQRYSTCTWLPIIQENTEYYVSRIPLVVFSHRTSNRMWPTDNAPQNHTTLRLPPIRLSRWRPHVHRPIPMVLVANPYH